MTAQDPELSAALGWPGGISDPVLDRTLLLQMVAALRLASQQALEALYQAREFTELYDTEHAAAVNEQCHDTIATISDALAESGRDWSLLEATQESLREHMAEIQILRAALAQQAEAAQEQDVEDAIEAAYWQFDCRKNGLNEWASAPQSERDAFKAEARKLVRGYFPTRQAQDTKREMLAVADAFIRGKRAALAQQAEPVQEPVATTWRSVLPGGKRTDEWESARIADYNAGWNAYCKAATSALEKLWDNNLRPVVEFRGRRMTPEGTRECWGVLLCDVKQDPPEGTKLYTAPPRGKLVPLTEEEILAAVGWERAAMYMKLTPSFPVDEAKKETLTNARAVEKAVWEKNHG